MKLAPRARVLYSIATFVWLLVIAIPWLQAHQAGVVEWMIAFALLPLVVAAIEFLLSVK